MSFFGSAVAQAMNRALKCPVSTGQSGKESLVGNCLPMWSKRCEQGILMYSSYILFTKAGVSADARTDKLRCLFSIFVFLLSFLPVACFSTVAAFGLAVRSVWTQCLDVLGSFKKLNACRVRGFFVASQSIAFSDITTSNMCCIKWLCRRGLRSSSVKLTSRNSVLVMSCTSFVQALCKVAWPKDASCQLNLRCLKTCILRTCKAGWTIAIALMKRPLIYCSCYGVAAFDIWIHLIKRSCAWWKLLVLWVSYLHSDQQPQ